ncbi:MAG: hypothetical protein Q7R41_05545 [Phycisphaerales bacterium]|nr:hypothetical protein [Phycisphaerales bacterium]
MRRAFSLTTVLLVVLCAPRNTQGDATVWTNGAGIGGATVRVTGADGVVSEQTITGSGTGGLEFVSGEGVEVQFGWSPNWSIRIFGYAVRAGASYGDGGVASIALLSGLNLFGTFEPPGSSGTSFRITGSGDAVSLNSLNEADIHYALLRVTPDVIPEGFLGTADDLVAQAIIAPGDVLTQFSASYPAHENFDELVALAQTFDQENLTLLAWIHGKCVTSCLVPTMSAWGVAAMTLLILSAATVVLIRRRSSQPA